MFRKFAILFCMILCFTEILGAFKLIRQILETKDWNITRVRTLEEKDARSGELVVLDFIGLVEQYPGYTAEEYDVKTDDGYILKLHRICSSPRSPQQSGKPAVLFMHGLFGSSDFQAVLGPDYALTFQLADAGYDVWLGNVRGNTYSKQHVKFSSIRSDPDFWNFSMDEMGTHDLPKIIDTILKKTGQKKLTYIGYSMGVTISFILLSEKPEYNKKMNVVISIAPVAFFTPPYSSLVNSILVASKPAKAFALTNRLYEILPQSKLIQIIGKEVCTSGLGKIFCDTFLTTIVNPKNMNFTAVPTITSYIPAGTSLNTLDHYLQMIISGKPRKYRHRLLGNSARYDNVIPPEYDFSKITSRQALFYSEDDVFVSEVDAATVKKNLKNVVAYEKAPKGYNHLDFMWSVTVKEDINDRVLEVIAENL